MGNQCSFFQQLKTICSFAREVILLLISRFVKITPFYFLKAKLLYLRDFPHITEQPLLCFFFRAATLHT